MSSKNLSLTEVAEDLRVVNRARDRVSEAVKGEVSTLLRNTEVEILSFPLAVFIVKAVGFEHLYYRFALAEAQRVEKLLRREYNHNIVENTMGFTIDSPSISEALRVVWRKEKNIKYYKMPFMEYLHRATKLGWRLQDLHAGNVYLSEERLRRLVQEEVMNLILTQIRNLNPPTNIPKNIKDIVIFIRKLSPPPSPKPPISISQGDYPPCISSTLQQLEKGINLPHYTRIFLTTYLASTGKTEDEIIRGFRSSPDFTEETTTYQVKHLLGGLGGRTVYHPPSCKNLLQHGVCTRSKECGKVKHPLQFRKR